ncbi:carbon-nitrogen hydrolase family protein [Chimaeribacter coloradensis]|uniref:Carbon-nitrogen hydrolase family protein n=1 Tax=Chimaeribacter coloradensis TaxID=2060068 RepID=A0A2N5ED73_9GAMM|nr:carbon-nitrogen hydrolase family protein [Chimaeribacter coloradensis]PLR40471.1 carbon-nitrogen hydrolase family protein [Chimaeribacter coloradensis]
MSRIVIAAAQYCSVPCDIEKNVSLHREFIALAAEEQVNMLIFPELSITGYEISHAPELALMLGDPRLEPLRQDAQRHNMTVVFGAPIITDDRGTCCIGAVTCEADGTLYAYTKQHLAGNEPAYFSQGEGGPLVQVQGYPVGLAICADVRVPSHPAKAALSGAQVYTASVLFSEEGYREDTETLESYARQHQMAVLMANHGGYTGGWQPAGKSAIWAEGGRCIARAPSRGNALVVGTRHEGQWQGHVLSLE